MTFPTTHPALARALAARGYAVATAVQTAVLEENASGRDLLVSAQTGSGKTVAFGLALGGTLLGEAERMERATVPLALIVAPTRELALQVCRELAWLYEETGARVISCVGGMDPRAEARQLESGAHIVVGTPGRLRDHIERRRLDLSGLAAVVLDEADEMLDLGFREDLEFILDRTPAERRTLLFSATLPREIETLAGRYQREAVRIATVSRNEQHADIDYLAHRVVPHDVENAVVNVLRLHEAPAAIVFCATREAVNRLNARLLERGFASVALSGELSQAERGKALQALRDGRARVLVATDVAARGLDLPNLALVVHAELPNDGETLLHRSGRTGRAGRKGLCVLIVPFNRRRKADAVIGAARLRVMWQPAPTPDEIRARDQERFLAEPSFTTPATEDEQRSAKALQEARSADEIALALVRLRSAQMPAPEELAVDSGPPPRREWQQRGDAPRQGRYGDKPFGNKDFGNKDWKRRGEAGEGRTDAPRRYEPRTFEQREPRAFQARSHESGAAAADGSANEGSATDVGGFASRDSRPPRPRRQNDREMVWFRINIGRERDADPRWLLPLICRAGGVTKAEIGAIRVEDRDTRFEIAADAADAFAIAARSAKKKEGHITRLDRAGQAIDGGGERPPEEIAAVADAIDALAAPGGASSDAAGGGHRADRAHKPRGPKKPWAARPEREHGKRDHTSWQEKRNGSEPKPFEARHSETRHSDAKHSETRHSETRPAEAPRPGSGPSETVEGGASGAGHYKHGKSAHRSAEGGQGERRKPDGTGWTPRRWADKKKTGGHHHAGSSHTSKPGEGGSARGPFKHGANKHKAGKKRPHDRPAKA